jgi:molecular chaperone DnaK (HSP70)
VGDLVQEVRKMTEKQYKTTEAQRKAQREYRKRNKGSDLNATKRSALSFIRTKANTAELNEFKQAIGEREKQLKNNL